MMGVCKWYQKEMCVNADCPMCCEYCPVADVPGVCRFEEKEGGINMNREEILKQARKRVCGREKEYNDPENNFATIAMFWTAYLAARNGPHLPLDSMDVANMMVLLKVARVAASDGRSEDSFVDIAGYAACAGEIAAKYWAMMDEED